MNHFLKVGSENSTEKIMWCAKNKKQKDLNPEPQNKLINVIPI
jgi:hypothetical protein